MINLESIAFLKYDNYYVNKTNLPRQQACLARLHNIKESILYCARDCAKTESRFSVIAVVEVAC